MAEALAALSIAANVFQVIDFSVSLITTANKIRAAGSTSSHAELNATAEDLRTLNERFKTTLMHRGVSVQFLKDERDLNSLATESVLVADELISLLGLSKNRPVMSKRESYALAVRAMWNKSKVDLTATKLISIRDRLQFHILVHIKSRINELSTPLVDLMDSFDDAIKNIMIAIMENREEFKTGIQAQTVELSQRQDRSDAAALHHKDEILNTIRNSPLFVSTVSTHCHADNLSERILNLLDFRNRNDRHEEIALAHQKTFEWIYKNTESPKIPGTDLLEWLKSGSGVFWINGKAGSGKSTFMKFIDNDPRTKEALTLWASASASPLTTASYYFWNTGTEMQKSWKGLLQSLLYHVLEKQPALIPVAFPEAFQPIDFNFQDFPNYLEVKRAFRRVLVMQQGLGKLFLLVDGLDEYEANGVEMAEMAEYFKIIVAMNRNIKVLLSSRPLPAFVEAFGGGSQLRLQDLTVEDISTYVKDKIDEHARVKILRQEDPEGIDCLVSELVGSADGVFLWVELVVRSLLDGLRNYDGISHLLRRLRELPPDLYDLFEYLISKIPAQYCEEALRLFRVAHESASIKDADADSMSPMTAMTLFFAVKDPNDALAMQIQPLSATQKLTHILELEGVLRSRCLGLLEIQETQSRDFWVYLHQAPSVLSSELTSTEDLQILKSHVQFFHKSVSDFLNEPAIWKNILAKMGDARFDINVHLLGSYLMQIKTWAPLYEADGINSPYSSLWKLVGKAVIVSHLAELSTNVSRETLLDELDRVMQHHYNAAYASFKVSPMMSCLPYHMEEAIHWSDLLPEDYARPCAWHDTFLSFAIRNGLVLYVKDKFDRQESLCVAKHGRPLLDYAINPIPVFAHWRKLVNPNMVQLLLENGADPNEQFDDRTPWQNCLYHLLHYNDDMRKWTRVLELLILHGADPNGWCEGNHRLAKLVSEKWRFSALRLIRLLFQVRQHGGSDDPNDALIYHNPEESDYFNYLRRYVRFGEHVAPGSVELTKLGDHLSKLLIDRGAKEAEWHGGRLVYPEARESIPSFVDEGVSE